MNCDTQTHKNQRVAAPSANYIVDNLGQSENSVASNKPMHTVLLI